MCDLPESAQSQSPSTNPRGRARGGGDVVSMNGVPALTDRTKQLLTNQQDVLAYWQLSALERKSVRRAVARGDWQKVTERTVLASIRQLDASAEMWAAILHCGQEALLGGRNALVLHGWRGDLTRPFDVVVASRVQPPKSEDWIRVHRLNAHRRVGTNPPRVPVHDAVLQAAGWARSEREAMYVLVSALQQRLSTPDRILRRLQSNTPRRGLICAMVLEYRDGIQSLNEYDFAALCRRFGLPRPTRQVLIHDAQGKGRSIDVEFDLGERTLRVEIEGVHHLNPDSWIEDIDRHNDIVLAGESPYLRVASLTLRLDPRPFMTKLRRAL